jgi:hypothetical protein
MISVHEHGSTFSGASSRAQERADTCDVAGKIEAFPKLESGGGQVLMVVSISRGEGFA